MDAKAFLNSVSEDEARRVCEDVGTTLVYLKQLATGFRYPSRKLALALEEASDGRMLAERLVFPDRDNQQEPTSAPREHAA